MSLRPILAASALAVATSACAPVGLLYTGVSAPPDTQALNNTGGERAVTKTGESCAHGVLGLVAWGDASQGAAAADGDISTVYAADEQRFSILTLVYRRYCTVVSGK